MINAIPGLEKIRINHEGSIHMKPTLNFRRLTLLGGFACLVILGSAYLIEYGFKQAPCSLCLLQRYVLWLLCILFFLAGLHAPNKVPPRIAYLLSTFFLSVIGLLLTLRQIWIQHLPKETVPNCVADLERVLKFQPLLEAAKTILSGGGECRESKFTLLGLSLAENAALAFIVLAIFSLVLIFFVKKRRI